MVYGTVILNGHRYPVDAVELKGGEVVLTFTLRGPIKPFTSAITVIGADGKGLWQGKTWVLKEPIPAGHAWECHYGMRLAQVLTGDQVTELREGTWP